MLITLRPLITPEASSQKHAWYFGLNFLKNLIKKLVPLVQVLFQGRSTLKLFRIIHLPVTNYHMRLPSQLKFRITSISKIVNTYLSARFTEKIPAQSPTSLLLSFPPL